MALRCYLRKPCATAFALRCCPHIALRCYHRLALLSAYSPALTIALHSQPMTCVISDYYLVSLICLMH